MAERIGQEDEERRDEQRDLHGAEHLDAVEQGIQLLAVYAIIAVALCFLPANVPPVLR